MWQNLNRVLLFVGWASLLILGAKLQEAREDLKRESQLFEARVRSYSQPCIEHNMDGWFDPIRCTHPQHKILRDEYGARRCACVKE